MEASASAGSALNDLLASLKLVRNSILVAAEEGRQLAAAAGAAQDRAAVACAYAVARFTEAARVFERLDEERYSGLLAGVAELKREEGYQEGSADGYALGYAAALAARSRGPLSVVSGG